MARKRLSWDKEKKAEQDKKADPYTMNQNPSNPPASKYDIGGPSDFAEDPDTKTPWKNEGRVETGHPAPIKEAVKAARQLEDKALKCITIAQRVLPGASDSIIEEQATDLMYLPDKCILATLQRQSELAEVLAKDNKVDDDVEAGKAAKKDEEVPAEKKDDEEVEKAAKKDEEVPAEKKDDEEVEKAAKKDEEVPAEKKDDEEVEKAAKKDDKAPAKKDDEVPAENGDDKAPVEATEKKATDIELSDDSIDLLDSVFANEEKTGAKKLSGIVKKASTGNQLDGLWKAPPDVSEAFNV